MKLLPVIYQPDDTVFVIGGGPSLASAPTERLQGRHIITCNEGRRKAVFFAHQTAFGRFFIAWRNQ